MILMSEKRDYVHVRIYVYIGFYKTLDPLDKHKERDKGQN